MSVMSTRPFGTCLLPSRQRPLELNLAQTVEEDEKNAANFGGFTFVTENVLDGVRYSSPFDDLDHEFDFLRKIPTVRHSISNYARKF